MIRLFPQDGGIEVAGLNMEAKESSKQEECAAICRLRGVTEGAPLSLQLKAIDQEYHHLLDSGQSGKADHVQGLYVWKNKQATQVCILSIILPLFANDLQFADQFII